MRFSLKDRKGDKEKEKDHRGKEHPGDSCDYVFN